MTIRDFLKNTDKLLTAREGNMGNCHSEKTNVERGEAKADIGFRGMTISHVTSRTVNIYYYILNVDYYIIYIVYTSTIQVK